MTSVNEETKQPSRIPGLAALLSPILVVAILVVVTLATPSYHGIAFLQRNTGAVPLGREVFGAPFDKLLLLAIATSAVAAAVTRLVTLSRTSLSMAYQGAFPPKFGEMNATHRTPLWGTVVLGGVVVLWYILTNWVTPNFGFDAVAAAGLLIALVYGLVGLACVVYYRRQLLASARNLVFMGLAPLAAAGMFFYVAYLSVRSLAVPANSYSGSWIGVGAALLICCGAIVVGVGIMVLNWVLRPRFFKRRPETWSGRADQS